MGLKFYENTDDSLSKRCNDFVYLEELCKKYAP